MMNKFISKEFYVLGTTIQLRVYGEKSETAADEAVKRLYDIDDKMSVFKDSSEISGINKNAGKLPYKVSKNTYFVVKKAVEYSRLSGGAFDITIRPTMNLWGFGTDNPDVPDNNEILSKIKLTNYKDIILDENKITIMLKHEKEAIDLGGIAKGFAADEVRRIFIRNDIKSAIIDLGGNIVVVGKKPDGTPWNVGIQNPLSLRGEFTGILSTFDKSVVTSGNYERFFVKDGKRFHHIMDPKTGGPSENGIISVTVVSDNSIDGDALTTCAYVSGLDSGIRLIKSIDGIDAVFITENKKVYVTDGIKDSFKLTSTDYTLEK